MKLIDLVVLSSIVLILFKSNVDSLPRQRNVGLILNSLTNLMRNQTCGLTGNGCKYFMKICLSLFINNCSLGNFTTLSWEIAPGTSKNFSFFDYITSTIKNPYRPPLNTWKKQATYLNASVWKEITSNSSLVEEYHIQTRLPFPTNNAALLVASSTQLTMCESNFCLSVSIYVWCAPLDCAEYEPTSVYSHLKPSSAFPHLLPSAIVRSTEGEYLATVSQKRQTFTITQTPRTVTTIRLVSLTIKQSRNEIALTASGTEETSDKQRFSVTKSVQGTTSTQLKQVWATLSSSKTCKILFTISQSCNLHGSSNLNKENASREVLKSWWFFLVVIVSGLLIALGAIVIFVRCRMRRGSNTVSVLANPNNAGTEKNNQSSKNVNITINLASMKK